MAVCGGGVHGSGDQRNPIREEGVRLCEHLAGTSGAVWHGGWGPAGSTCCSLCGGLVQGRGPHALCCRACTHTGLTAPHGPCKGEPTTLPTAAAHAVGGAAHHEKQVLRHHLLCPPVVEVFLSSWGQGGGSIEGGFTRANLGRGSGSATHSPRAGRHQRRRRDPGPLQGRRSPPLRRTSECSRRRESSRRSSSVAYCTVMPSSSWPSSGAARDRPAVGLKGGPC